MSSAKKSVDFIAPPIDGAIEVLKKDLEYHKHILEFSLFKKDAKEQKNKIKALGEALLVLEKQEKLKVWLEKEIVLIRNNKKPSTLFGTKGQVERFRVLKEVEKVLGLI
jgi:hypothetical protein